MDEQASRRFSRFRPAWRAFGVWYFGAFLFMAGPWINPQLFIGQVGGIVVGALILAAVVVKRFTSLYEVGDGSIKVRTAFPSPTEESCALADIRRIDLMRGASHRLLGVAGVHIYVDGEEEPVLKIYGVPKPVVFKQWLISLGARDQRVYGAFRK